MVDRGRRFAIVTHSLPDGDAAGATAGLYRFLVSLGKKVDVVNAMPADPVFSQFFSAGVIRKKFRQTSYDAVFVLDCGDYARSGLEPEIRALKSPVANIDHHMTNPMFGDVNIVITTARAASEILFDLFEAYGGKKNLPLSRSVAEPLLHGMMTDTRVFQVYGLGPEYFRKVARLLDSGISYDDMFGRITQSNSLASLKSLFSQMTELRQSPSKKVIWTLIGRNGMAGKNFDLIHFQLLELLMSVTEARIVFVCFDQGRDGIHVEIRSKKPFKAVEPALLLDGGGHLYASGAQVLCSLEQSERRVIAAIRKTYPGLLEGGKKGGR